MHQVRPGRQRSSGLAVWFGILAIITLIVVACGTSDDPEQGDEPPQVQTVMPTQTATAQEPEPSPTRPDAAPDLPRAEPPGVGSAETVAFVEGMNTFAFDLYQAVIEDEDGNLIYSPASIELAFSMVYAGARGDTEAQMADVLGFLPQEDQHPAANALDQQLASLGEGESAGGEEQGEPFQLNIANAIWGQEGHSFLEEFLETLATNYGAGLRIADFVTATEAARQEINAWIEERTEGRIEEAIPDGALNEMTRLVLANAVYFNAGWLYPFDEGATVDGNFTLLDGSQVSVPMMKHLDPVSIPYLSGDGYQAVLLPYAGQTVEMAVILPDEGGFEEIEADLSAEFIDQARHGVGTRDIVVSMPRFDFQSDFDLTEILPGMGMPDPFSGVDADFSGIADPSDLFIAEAIHKATIAVDEKGTEAAAVTIIGMEDEEAMERTELVLDRPFIFAITERETGAILFLGRVSDPSN